ncbi:acyl-CoA thioesterase [Ideonella paludis]|uniref:Acyl-CoA thioesterase n=1 Tax=Ideonella paludis TaxID=1233411 RepID=A0ABS5DRW6_9BURK|nr:thioesterase family protein [Ideonella paludis]MBQ0933896.1 acyl-CoA thioesterase [Ideonella paludis]
MTWDHPHPFTLAVTPGPADIDGLGHTNNAVYVQWCERIGWAHSEALGLSLADYHRLDRAMAIQRGEYDYLLPTFAGDTLTLATWLLPGDGKLRMERHFQLLRQNPGDSSPTTVLRGRWQLVCIAISSGAPKRMPPEFVQAYLPACVTLGC